MNETLSKLERENKYCLLMGDFNVNLLNYDCHPPTQLLIFT